MVINQKQEFEFDKIPILSGENLKLAIERTKESRDPLIKDLIYKHTSTLLYSPDGVGKSVLALQIAIESTVESGKVFGNYQNSKPCKVIYFQMERHEDESLERIKHMLKISTINYNNLIIDTSWQGLFVNNKDCIIKMLSRLDWMIFESFGNEKPDIIIVDPIYTLLPTGFTEAESVFLLNNFARLIQNKYDCSIIFTHHANRGQRNQKTGRRENEDMFGSRFLSAHFNSVYSIKQTDEGTIWKLEKSSYHNTDKEINLTYDFESNLSFIRLDGITSDNKQSLIDSFINMRKKDLKPFTINELKSFAKCSPSYATKSIDFALTQNGVNGECEREFLEKILPKLRNKPILYQFKSRSH